MTAQTETLIDAGALAKKLNVHEVTIRRWQSSGKIPAPVRLGAAVRWRLKEIDAWIESGCPPRPKWETHRQSAKAAKL
ncbi:MAG: helix-turn-helix domain-containing protein [Planctomycetes bacterium]|nr:helix-turn-helix domain-containing protein [Planctomycetota bacterium]